MNDLTFRPTPIGQGTLRDNTQFWNQIGEIDLRQASITPSVLGLFSLRSIASTLLRTASILIDAGLFHYHSVGGSIATR